MIDSPETMIKAIREYGIIPFFKCGVPGWSIEEMTDPSFWFFSSDELGPWDWKIDAVREGDIAYGKFLGGKAAFATVEFYRHLINWRRSIPRYRVALGEKYPAKTASDKLMKGLSPTALEIIRNNGAAESREIRIALSEAVSPTLLRSLGSSYKSKLTPSVKKSIADSITQFLEMGTWTIIGDFTRVYRGADLQYSGWQRSSFTTPEALFGKDRTIEDAPFWARHFEESSDRDGINVDCSPEESRQLLVEHVLDMFPGEKKQIERMI